MFFKVLSDTDHVENFDCGNKDLNIFLIKNALNYQKSFVSKTYLLHNQNTIYGFYSISATLIEQQQTDIRWPKHPLPAVLLGRLAVDLKYQKQHLGSLLFAHACKNTVEVANTIGCVALITEAKNQNAFNFYSKFGMKPFKNKQDTLYLKIKNIIKVLNP